MFMNTRFLRTLIDQQMQMLNSMSAVATLAVEAQTVVGFRMMGLAGLWSVTKSENRRMVDEKFPAFAESAMSALFAGVRGMPPAAVMQAAVKPLRKRTRSNSRRLARRGPRLHV